MKSTDLRALLGWIVAGAGIVACGGSTAAPEYPPGPGKLTAEGTRTEGAREITEWGIGSPKCTDQEWSYELQPAYACQLGKEWSSTYQLPCASLCGDGARSCSIMDRPDRTTARPYVSPDAPSCPAAPGFLQCTKSLRDGCAIEGRRPDGLIPLAGAAYASVGAYFAHCAYLEAAAVDAFDRLVIEAEAHDAPPELVARLRRAAAEERRHTELASGLARRFGGQPERPVLEGIPVRTLFEIARENVVEGVIRETYGAAVALWRAAHAEDADVAATLREIAEDECRHATLSWDFAAWAERRLDALDRAELARAAEAARAELRALVLAEPPADLVREAGVPTAAVAASLVAMLDATAWSSRVAA